METRSAPRIKVELKSLMAVDDSSEQSIILTKEKSFEAVAFDISEGGLGITMKKYYLPRGASVELLINGLPFGLKDAMNIKGKIAYCKTLKTREYRCGIKFMHLSPEYKKAIKAFIAVYDRRESPRLDLPR